MRILQLTSHLNVGGIPRYVISLSQQLKARGHDVVIASGGGTLESAAASCGIPHHFFQLQTSAEFGPGVLNESRRLAIQLMKEPVDVIHAHTRVSQVVADRVSKQTGVPYVTTWHGIYRPRLGRKWWPCTGKITIAISNPVRESLIRDFHVPEQNIRRIYNGINIDYYAAKPDAQQIDRFRSQWNIAPGVPTVGGIGRLAAGEVKGFDLLLVAVYLSLQEIPDLRVLIVGDGPRRPFLEDVARRLRILEHVRFIGTTQDIRVPLGLMDVFVFPSRWPEAFGLTLIEAMAAGKPVVATRMGAVSEIVEEGVTGCIVSPEDPAALSREIIRLFENRFLIGRLGGQAHQRAQMLFNLERMTAEIEIVYQEAVSQSL